MTFRATPLCAVTGPMCPPPDWGNEARMIARWMDARGLSQTANLAQRIEPGTVLSAKALVEEV